ncbi:MAG: ribokinase [Actinomycetia bacterium]|nr:ribokinase [Actinomycetes bacterium]
MKKPKIVVVGSINIDLVVKSYKFPLPGETVIGNAMQTFPGGKGANQAVAASRLGADVQMVGCVGDDVFGEDLIGNLKTNRVGTDFVRKIKDKSSGIAMIIVSENGQNSIVLAPGANMMVNKELVEKAENVIKNSDALIVQFEIPLDVVFYTIDMAKTFKKKIFLNPAPAQKIPDAILKKVDYIIPNETEATIITGIQVKDLNTAQRAASNLINRGSKSVILTLGENGCLLVSEKEMIHLSAFSINVVDTTSAGDAFVSAFAVGILRNFTEKRAAEYANIAGALASTKLGAQSSLPTRKDIEMFLKNI